MSGCNCGSSCNCGSDCKCGKKYPDLSVYETTNTTQTVIVGVAPVKMYHEGSEMSYGAENDDKRASGCKCGDSCSCDPCKC